MVFFPLPPTRTKLTTNFNDNLGLPEKINPTNNTFWSQTYETKGPPLSSFHVCVSEPAGQLGKS